MTTYPAKLVFDLAGGAYDGAVIEAARDLQLPFVVDGPQQQITVVVDAPMTAYRFGLRTAELWRRTGKPLP